MLIVMRKLLIVVSYIITNRRHGRSVVTLSALNPTSILTSLTGPTHWLRNVA